MYLGGVLFVFVTSAGALAPIDPTLHPIMYLGGVDHNGASASNYSQVGKFQVVAIINSYCWSPSRSQPINCTNETKEFGYIVEQSAALRKASPGVLTQMYINSLMNFWWYTEMFAHFDPTQGGDASLLLHDVNGSLVSVRQDGGNPNMTIFDWGQAKTRSIYLSFVDKALSSGITSFFFDKASTMANLNTSVICQHECAQLTPVVAKAWNAGHAEVMALAVSRSQSTGPSVGNNDAPFGSMMYHLKADQGSIELLKTKQSSTTMATIAASFPFQSDGYAAFLVAYQQGRSFMWKYVLDVEEIWIGEFEQPLGAPSGPPATVNASGVYTRDFENVVVTFNTKTNKGSFAWKQDGIY